MSILVAFILLGSWAFILSYALRFVVKIRVRHILGVMVIVGLLPLVACLGGN